MYRERKGTGGTSKKKFSSYSPTKYIDILYNTRFTTYTNLKACENPPNRMYKKGKGNASYELCQTAFCDCNIIVDLLSCDVGRVLIAVDVLLFFFWAFVNYM